MLNSTLTLLAANNLSVLLMKLLLSVYKNNEKSQKANHSSHIVYCSICSVHLLCFDLIRFNSHASDFQVKVLNDRSR